MFTLKSFVTLAVLGLATAAPSRNEARDDWNPWTNDLAGKAADAAANSKNGGSTVYVDKQDDLFPPGPADSKGPPPGAKNGGSPPPNKDGGVKSGGPYSPDYHPGSPDSKNGGGPPPNPGSGTFVYTTNGDALCFNKDGSSFDCKSGGSPPGKDTKNGGGPPPNKDSGNFVYTTNGGPPPNKDTKNGGGPPPSKDTKNGGGPPPSKDTKNGGGPPPNPGSGTFVYTTNGPPESRNKPCSIGPSSPTNYTVVAGDTLGKIADHFGVGVCDIQKANPTQITNINVIFPGEVLVIPTNLCASDSTTCVPKEGTKPCINGPDFYTVVSGDTLTTISAKFDLTLDAVKKANHQVTNPDVITISQILNLPQCICPK